tara:strand:+ start:123 stop:365 length:243 start_codon:yes stop_codon:yes gene_type:complete
MASKYFEGVANLRKTLLSVGEGCSVILQVSDGVKFDPAMRAVTATICRGKTDIKIKQQCITGVETDTCKGLRMIKVTRVK